MWVKVKWFVYDYGGDLRKLTWMHKLIKYIYKNEKCKRNEAYF